MASKPLRDWQNKAIAAWTANNFRGIAQVVTGGGKTFLAGAAFKLLQASKPDAKLFVVVPTIALADQWFVALVEDHKYLPDEIAIWGGGNKISAGKLITIAVTPTAIKLTPGLSNALDILLVFDECHHAGAPTVAAIASIKFGATLGLSATPERQYDESFNEQIVPLLGPIIVNYGYEEALADGVICPFELTHVFAPMDAVEDEKFRKLSRNVAVAIGKFGHGSPEATMALRARARMVNSVRSRVIIAIELIKKYSQGRTIVFDESIERVELIKSGLLMNQMTALTYHSRMSPAAARSNLLMYRRGQAQVLLTCRALDEGANIPETETGIIVSSTASERQRVQRLGRVLRALPGKQSASIYTIYSTEQEKQRLLKPGAERNTRWMTTEFGANKSG